MMMSVIPATSGPTSGPTTGPPSEPAGEPAATEPELTIDRLAAAVGLTVRTVRSYTTRGLLPPPRLRGRTGIYGPEHLARLSLLRQMLDDGYTLAAAEQVLAAAPSGITGPGLDLYRSLLNPWHPEEPEIIEVQVLAARMGTVLDEAMITRWEQSGLLERLPDGRLRVLSPMLVRAGLQLIGLGIDAEPVLQVQAELAHHARAMALACVDLFRRSVWQPFLDSGAPEEGWAEVRQVFDRALPVASQAVAVTFRLALSEAIATAVAEARANGEELPHPDEHGL